MKNHLRYILSLGLLLSGFGAFAQQDVQFSQYSFNGITLNPAYTGYKQDLMFNTFYRQQWTGIQGAPKSGGVTVDGSIDEEGRMALGLEFLYDKTGPQSTVNAYALYAYHLPLNVTTGEQVSFGIGAGFTQYGLDGTQFKYIDAGDPSIATQSVSAFIPDVKAGIQYFGPTLTAGISVNNILSVHSNQKVYYNDGLTTTSLGRSPQLNFHVAYLADISKDFKFKPEVLFKEDFQSPGAVDLNASILISERLWLGAGYRTAFTIFNKSSIQNVSSANGVSAIIQYEFSDFRLGYAYEFSTAPLATYRGGTHEISLGIYFGDKHRRTRFF